MYHSKPADFSIVGSGITYSYRANTGRVPVLANLSFSVRPNSSIALVGSSGSGKTTMLKLCSGIEIPERGSIQVLGVELAALTESERADFRSKNIGFVFQDFKLLPSLTVAENIKLPAMLLGRTFPQETLDTLLFDFGIQRLAKRYPGELSGGEQQRVAIARALVNTPPILICDEPTGNLDANSANIVTQAIFREADKRGSSIVFATHDEALSKRCDSRLLLI
jgi:putative ABC transport system ATP-binding protein